jgi:fermentation-respiration switch protein FrsA (DUF1100 family)
MIGGGADFWLMITHSNYAKWIDAFRVTWTGRERSAEDVAGADGAYLALTPLDSFHTAAALKGKPVLMIVGDYDRAVPTQLGKLLWDRIGEKDPRSEYWTRPVGHELLFVALPRDFDAIGAWIERAIAKK